MKRVIDCAMLCERAQAHQYLAQELCFPEYYGRNLDALYDCLTEMGDCTIVLRGAEEVRAAAGYGACVLKVMEEAAQANARLALEQEACKEGEEDA